MNEPWLLLVLGGLLGILLAALAVLFMQVRRLPVEQQQQEARLQARLEQLSRELATFQQGSIRMGEKSPRCVSRSNAWKTSSSSWNSTTRSPFRTTRQLGWLA